MSASLVFTHNHFSLLIIKVKSSLDCLNPVNVDCVGAECNHICGRKGKAVKWWVYFNICSLFGGFILGLFVFFSFFSPSFYFPVFFLRAAPPVGDQSKCFCL